MENARFGVSISNVSSLKSRFTRTLILPSVRRICVERSLRSRKENPVSLDSRTVAAPKCSSARDPWSVHSLSPIVIGRFSSAPTQSSVPAGSNDTAPWRYPSRATRLGGSSSSAAARCGTDRAIAHATRNQPINLSPSFSLISSLLDTFLILPWLETTLLAGAIRVNTIWRKEFSLYATAIVTVRCPKESKCVQFLHFQTTCLKKKPASFNEKLAP